MNRSELLRWLQERTRSLGRPLPETYLQCLRQAFLAESGMLPEGYRSWLSRLLGVDIDCQGLPSEGDLPADLRARDLLEVGDACASEQLATGSFYTPDPIARFMTGESLRRLVTAADPGLGPAAEAFFRGQPTSLEDRTALRHRMRAYRVLDLACGNGVFLEAVLEWYLKTWERGSESGEAEAFVQGCLYGVDIRKDALESLCIRLALAAPSLADSAGPWNIAECSSVEGDALLEVPWMKRTMGSGGFDLVVGNPPYLGEKGNRELFDRLRAHPFGERCYEGRMDLFYYFLHRGLEVLKPGGLLSQITTGYYATADFASKLRARLKTSGGIAGLVSFNEQPVFPKVKGHHVILFYENEIQDGTADLLVYETATPLSKYGFEDLGFHRPSPRFRTTTLADRRALFDGAGHIVLDPGRWEIGFLDEMQGVAWEPLGALVRIHQGIVSGADREAGAGVFVLEPEEVRPGMEPYLVPWFKNSDIRRYRPVEETGRRLLYLSNEREADVPEAVLGHLRGFRKRLEARRECALGRRPWYGLQWPREKAIFTGPKIVAPQRSVENRFAFTDKSWFASADVYFLTDPGLGVSLHALTAYLNSRVVYCWLSHFGKRKGNQLELYATPLSRIPVRREWVMPGSVLDLLGQALGDPMNGMDLRLTLETQVEQWLGTALKLSDQDRALLETFNNKE